MPVTTVACRTPVVATGTSEVSYCFTFTLSTSPLSSSDAARGRALVRLAVLAFRRTAVESSARLLLAGLAVLVLADAALRVTTPHALDTWLVAALLWSVVLPSMVAGEEPLRSVRMALLPVPASLLRRARFVAGAPLRLLLVVAVPVLGVVAARSVAGHAAFPALVGWALVAFAAGDALDARWYRREAGGARAAAAVAAAVGGWCIWSIRTFAGSAPGSGSSVFVPALLPRTDGGWDWLLAGIGVAASVALVAVHLEWPAVVERLRAAPGPVIGHGSKVVTVVRAGGAAERASGRGAFGRHVGPRAAQEIALLARHIGPRVSLAMVALLALGAAYGRVPGLALGAALPVALLTANALGADAALGGIVRHALTPEPPERVRDRRLAIWALVTALTACFGAAVGLSLPAPESAGRPPGGALAAPAVLLYAAALVPWFGRASWWWARRYPQPIPQGLRDVGARRWPAGPLGPAHLALALLAAWAAVAMLAGLLWAGCAVVARAFLDVATDTLVRARPALGLLDAPGDAAWIVGVLLASAVAAGAHVGLAAAASAAWRRRWPARVKARA